MNKKRHHTLCPKCGGEKFVKSVFGSICGECFYEEKNTSEKGFQDGHAKERWRKEEVEKETCYLGFE